MHNMIQALQACVFSNTIHDKNIFHADKREPSVVRGCAQWSRATHVQHVSMPILPSEISSTWSAMPLSWSGNAAGRMTS